MSKILISEGYQEKIEFVIGDETYGIARTRDDKTTTILFNKRELMKLYMAIQDAITKDYHERRVL